MSSSLSLSISLSEKWVHAWGSPVTIAVQSQFAELKALPLGYLSQQMVLAGRETIFIVVELYGWARYYSQQWKALTENPRLYKTDGIIQKKKIVSSF